MCVLGPQKSGFAPSFPGLSLHSGIDHQTPPKCEIVPRYTGYTGKFDYLRACELLLSTFVQRAHELERRNESRNLTNRWKAWAALLFEAGL